ERAIRKNVLAQETDFTRTRPSDKSRQVPGSAAFRHDSPLRESGYELRPIAHQSDVASDRQVESLSRGRAVETEDYRSVDSMERYRGYFKRAEMGGATAGNDARATDTGARSSVLEVQAGTESAAFASKDDHANIGIVVIFLQAIAER